MKHLHNRAPLFQNDTEWASSSNLHSTVEQGLEGTNLPGPAVLSFSFYRNLSFVQEYCLDNKYLPESHRISF